MLNALFSSRGCFVLLCFFQWNSSFIDSSSTRKKNFFFFFLDMQVTQKLKCVHAQNVIHKHSLTGKEAENVNALKLRQHAFSIGTKL